ncbi:LysR family transcriptional regulator [Telmatospirillum sp.]|uniref:LysR family transcriptional regulator n=1 Tax=Telmatospirillum sp. TaxID=2079197 RepID=UPI00284B983A|nr:LysR family transcriptional regulator [Telmatospirillum sp.]MDR3439321.1 LysR family transcriptional regulator [Telmatospirillum sp.]
MIAEFSGDFIQWLRGFYYTVQTGSLSAATTIMNRNQSALSHQIKCLEDELGVKLFRGTKAKHELTDEGRFLLEKSIGIFDTINSIKNSIGTLPDSLSGEIGIAGLYTIVQHYLPHKVSQFSMHYPQVSFQLQGSACRQPILDMVASREVDIGIMCVDEAPQGFDTTPLFSTEVMCVSPKTGPYSVARITNLEQLASFPCIYPLKTSTMEPFLERQFGRFGLSPQNKYLVDHFEAAKICVGMGMGITFIDDFACTEVDRQKLNVVSMSAFFPRRVHSGIKRRDMFVPPHLEAFLRFLGSGTRVYPDTQTQS